MTATLRARVKRHRDGQLLTPLIDEYLRNSSRDGGVTFKPETLKTLNDLLLRPHRDRSGSFSASGLGSCMRAQIFSYLGSDQTVVASERKEAIFFNGHWLHLKWQGILIEMGVVMIKNDMPQLEIGVAIPEWNVKGTLDAICILKGEPWIVDVKGMGPGYWATMSRGQISQTYLWQQHAYMKATGIERAMLLVENKATGEYIELHLPPPSDISYVQMEARVRALNFYLSERTLPPKLPAFPYDNQCRECPYQLDCTDAKFTESEEIML